ncbi:hypothetical protein [Boudabousia marimammalium]|uniref:Uncharacterized protein n=1 Tax=Boudabousia marimammalium TaxID=156892 RepID=A0A1Q5PSF2_9ACTO|nr:hypothetical protein [Boudabousia marimammalium]OKL50463.1 hypothetical protein BM477_00345 [Boudabousia marimammalium]
MTNDKTVQIDEEMLRKMFDRVFHTHLRYATGRAKVIWRNFVDAFCKREHQKVETLKHEIEDCAHDSLQILCTALEEIDPRASLELLLGECHDRLHCYNPPRGGETFSIARGAWLIGVFGNGNNATQYEALKVFNKYVRWLATHLMWLHISSIASEDDDARIIRKAVKQLEINRLVEPETRMMWITAEITKEIGKWVEANSDSCSISDHLNSTIAEQINRNATRATNALKEAVVKGANSLPKAFSEMLLNAVPNEILQKLTATHRSISPANIQDVLNSDLPTFFPLVEIDDKYRVLGRSAWLMQREDALLQLCMQASPQHSRGKVFEDVTAALLQKWGPADIDWRSSVSLVDPRSSKNPDDIDVFGSATQTVFIGECKANRLSVNNSSVAANFDAVVLTKATSQLATRTTHWKSGWRPSNSDKAFADKVAGFITTFSSYGGLLWSSTEIGDKNSSVKFGIFPLHSLVLAISALKTPDQLGSYLEFRVNSTVLGVNNFDELEYMLSFLSKRDDRIKVVQDGATILFRQYELDDSGMWIDPRIYRDKKNWKDEFVLDLWGHTEPITPPAE